MTILYFLNNKIRNMAKGFVRTKCFREYEDIRRVLLLFDLEHAEEVVDFAKSLTFAGKEVHGLTFLPDAKTALPVVPENFKILNHNDLSFMGFPLSNVMENFKGIHPDTLIDLTVVPHPVLQYLSLTCEASYRVGFQREEKTFDDLLLEYHPEQRFDFLTSQLHFYMKSLRSK